MSGSPREQALAIENVEFVKHEESKRQRSAKKKRSGSDEPVLRSPPRDLPLYDEEKGEMNPLLGTSPKSGGRFVMPHQMQYGHQPYPVHQQSPTDYYNQRGQEQYYQGGYYYNGPHPPSPPQAYPPMMSNAAMYQYHDQMAAGVPLHPSMTDGQQQVHSPQRHYTQQQVSSPQSNHRQQHQRMSPHGSHRQTSYRDSTDGAEHPLKRSTHQGNEEYQVPLKGADPNHSYGAIRDATTPPKSSRSRSSRPPRRKSDTAPNQHQRPPSPLSRASHRRTSSDTKPAERHRRVSSDLIRANGPDPPKHRRSNSDRPPTGLAKIRKSLPFTSNRRRSSSGGAGAGSRNRPSHHRASSLSEISVGASVATSASMVSHVTDISKSAFFGGTDKTGKVQLHFPFESVRLTMDDALPIGILYMRHVEEEQYEDYHVFNDEQSEIPWELDGDLACQCTCLKCVGCTERNQQLAPSEYIMTVEDDLYRRVLDEISASRSMPCGCFFCGHHEDIDSPSILIAITIVFLLVVTLGIGSILAGA